MFGITMSASKRAKELGAPNLTWVALTLGRDVSTLHYRYKVEPLYFDVLVAGCVALHGDEPAVLTRLREQMAEVMGIM